MQSEYEEILRQLTESQIALILRMVQALGMMPIESMPQQDLDALESQGLIEYSESVDHKDSYTTHRETVAHGGGRPRPSKLGQEWVKWYVAHKP